MSIHHTWLAGIGLSLFFLFAAVPTSAQQAPSADLASGLAMSAAHVAGPVVAPAAFPGVSARPFNGAKLPGTELIPATATTPLAAAIQSRESQRKNVVLMAVGGAALIVGSLIDGDTGTVVMVAGGAVGLLGLYRYLQ